MRGHLLYAFVFLLTAVSCNLQKINRSADTLSVNRNSLNDSLEVLKKMGGLFGGISEPPSGEEKRYENILLSMDTLHFKIIDSLIFDKNYAIKLYAFNIGLLKYPDSLLPKHYRALTDDTTTVMLYSPKEMFNTGQTVGETAKMIMESAEKGREIDRMKPQLADSIKSFIRKYSSHPDSYKLISLDKWGYGGSDPHEPEYFEIGQTYQITDNENKAVTVSHFFVFTAALEISVIESKRTGLMISRPPKVNDWLIKYGRKLTLMDSIQLHLR